MTASAFVDRTWTSADGLALHARDYAAGPGSARAPVICLPGLTRNARDFEDLAPLIAEGGRRVLALDLRGRGRSAWSADPAAYTPPVYVMDVLALLDQAAIGRAVFVGTSLGGIVAMGLASARPAAIAGVLLNDIGAELAPAGLKRIAGYVGGAGAIKTWDDAARAARAINGLAFPDYGDGDWAAFARRLFHQQADGSIKADYDPAIAKGFARADTPPPDLWPLFTALPATGSPLALVRGALSDLLDPDVVQRMREAAPQMIYAEVPRVGHAPTLGESQATSAIDALLQIAP